MAFAWDFGDGVLKYFQFAVLPFGLSSAPFLFTKLLKPVVTSWRCKGIPMVIFLDDGLGGGANSIQAKINSLTVNPIQTGGGGLFEPPLRQNRDNSYTERAMTFKFSDFS